MSQRFAFVALSAVLLAATVQAQGDRPFSVEPITSSDEPWTLTLLPDGRMLVTEKMDNLLAVAQDGTRSRPIQSLPDVDYGGQGGLGT